MTGTPNFNTSCLLACLLPFAATAADISLLDESKLTGEVLAMENDGTLVIRSEIAAAPIHLRGDKIRSVSFPPASDLADVPTQRIKLTNGDILPARINSMSGDTVRLSSPDLGDLQIHRSAIDSIQLGVIPPKVVYRGPSNFSGWKTDRDGARNWVLDDDSFLAAGQGSISRDFDLPEKFIIRFQLTWTSNPNFRLFFADPLKEMGERVDRYFLQFAGAGLEVKREATLNNRYTPIVLLNRQPDQFPGKRIKVELKVDRSRGLIHLYINNQLEGRYTDPIPLIPKGGGVSLVSMAGRESEQRITMIEVLEWDDRGDRYRSEERGSGKSDALIGRFGERFGGQLQQIRIGPGGTVYLFKSDFQEEIIELPEDEVSTIFLAKENTEPTTSTADQIILRLSGDAKLFVTSCAFEADAVTATHPLLGPLRIRRSGLTMLERPSASKAEPVTEP